MTDSNLDHARGTKDVAPRPKRTWPPGSILVLGPGARGRGGIASVIRLHQETAAWRSRGLRLLATFDDTSTFHKVSIASAAYLRAPLLLTRAKLLHVHLAAQTSMLRKLPIIAMARLMRKPILIHFHAPSEESLFQKTPSWALRFVFRSAARVIALSGSWADAFRSFAPQTRTIVIPNPVRIHDPVIHDRANPKIILFVGKLEARKGYNDLLSAATEVLAQVPGTQLWFAGHGQLDQARARIEQLGLARSVRLLGWLDTEALDAIYRQTSLLVLPSYAEGVPMSVLEAMSHAIPVICTPVGGLAALVRNGENGLLVAPGDIPSLTRQIIRLLRTPNLADAIGSAGQRTVQESCCLSKISIALEALYDEVLHQADTAGYREANP